MKRFITTLGGKTLIFILCVISLCVFAAGALGMFFYLQDEMVFYSYSEQDLKKEIIEHDTARSYGYNVLWKQITDPPAGKYGYEYRITDEHGKKIAQSNNFDASKDNVYSFQYGIQKDASGAVYEFPYHAGDPYEENTSWYTVQLSFPEGSAEANKIALYEKLIHYLYAFRYAVYPIAFAALVIAAVLFIALMYASGRRPDVDGFSGGALYRVPYDLLLLICGTLGIGLCFAADAVTNINDLNTIGKLICIAMLCLIGLNIILGLCMSAASRIKQHTLLKNTVIYRVIKLIWKILLSIWNLVKKLHNFNISLLRGLPLIWKTGLVFCGISLLELLFIIWSDGNQDAAAVMWLIEKVILLPAILYLALTLRKLQKSGIALANGDLSYHTDTKGMIWDFKQHGEDMNKIADGMAIAVEDRLKSERMKTELITNVSHDLKTPLTSVINYASLIAGESCDNPKIKEYSDVLVRQSEKLKRLIEDLVEASKASTGNLDVSLAPCDAATFLIQAGGEYEEKLQNAGLTLITKYPEKELHIMADGRRMWRIFDNLMNNICKYAQSGTRVYLSLEGQSGNAVISFKNTSRDALDISEDELMERFTRGDSSRNTDGNGLGLSIAKSMAELQGGSLELSIDGDLFKAVLTFPSVR